MKTIFCTLILAFSLYSINLHAQDTIVGWTFPGHSADAVVDIYIPANANRLLKTEDPQRTIVYTVTGIDGNPDKCAQSVDWDNGDGTKYWTVEFVTSGYNNLKLSSVQRSCAMHHAPRDFKVQYKLHGQSTWTDVPGATVIDTANWTMGALNNIALPVDCDDQTQPMALRWIMTSNMDIKGVPVLNTGMSRIDNIFVTGYAISGIPTNKPENVVLLYPNPASDVLGVYFTNSEIKLLELFQLDGKLLYSETSISNQVNISVENLPAGMYLLRITENGITSTHKVLK